MKITILIGTNRSGSNTAKVARVIASMYAEANVSCELLDLHNVSNEIAGSEAYSNKPLNLALMAGSILNSDGLVIVTPEYNGGMPGILKLFIDMLPFPESFERRPVCFVGLAAGMWGALRPVEQLQAIFGYRNAYVYPERVFLPGIGKLLDDQGQFTNSDFTGRMQQQATGFIEFVQKLRSATAGEEKS